jgi:hypothetical protein
MLPGLANQSHETTRSPAMTFHVRTKLPDQLELTCSGDTPVAHERRFAGGEGRCSGAQWKGNVMSAAATPPLACEKLAPRCDQEEHGLLFSPPVFTYN